MMFLLDSTLEEVIEVYLLNLYIWNASMVNTYVSLEVFIEFHNHFLLNKVDRELSYQLDDVGGCFISVFSDELFMMCSQAIHTV
jgi:hypothetical protein